MKTDDFQHFQFKTQLQEMVSSKSCFFYFFIACCLVCIVLFKYVNTLPQYLIILLETDLTEVV